MDVIVRGEGEESIVEIAQGGDFRDVGGISYRDGDRIVHNNNRPLPEVDDYRYPDRGLRRQDYHMNVGGLAFRGEQFDIILTARGCPYNCKFCTFNLNPLGQKRNYSPRSLDSVMEEIRQVSAGIVLIADENFFVNPQRAKRICERIIAEDINKRFIVQARIEIFEHPDVLEVAVHRGDQGVAPGDRISARSYSGTAQQRIRHREIKAGFRDIQPVPILLPWVLHLRERDRDRS